jgi:uncharacterized protein YjbI with pentapeptide repeats
MLIGANLRKADFSAAHLQGARLDYADLRSAKVGCGNTQVYPWQQCAQAQGASFYEAQLQRAWLIGARLQGAVLYYAYLQGASLSRAQLQGAELGARLQGASLKYAHLQGADLTGADLVVKAGFPPEDMVGRSRSRGRAMVL